MIVDFYIWLERYPDLDMFFDSNVELKNEVKEKQFKYWHEIFTIDLDQKFFDIRISLAETHATIGLPLDSYFTGLAFFVNWIIKFINVYITTKTDKDNPKLKDDIINAEASFLKIVQIDQTLVVTHYVNRTNAHLDELVARQAETIIKLATPISILAEGILLISIVGVRWYITVRYRL